MGVFRDAMEQSLALRGLAPRTRSTYLNWVRRLVQFCRVVPPPVPIIRETAAVGRLV